MSKFTVTGTYHDGIVTSITGARAETLAECEAAAIEDTFPAKSHEVNTQWTDGKVTKKFRMYKDEWEGLVAELQSASRGPIPAQDPPPAELQTTSKSDVPAGLSASASASATSVTIAPTSSSSSTTRRSSRRKKSQESDSESEEGAASGTAATDASKGGPEKAQDPSKPAKKKRALDRQAASSAAAVADNRGQLAASASSSEKGEASSSPGPSSVVVTSPRVEFGSSRLLVEKGDPCYDSSAPGYTGSLAVAEGGGEKLNDMQDVHTFLRRLEQGIGCAHPLLWVGIVPTLPYDKGSKPWLKGPGGRKDAYFFVHTEDRTQFGERMSGQGVRWISGVYCNGGSVLRPLWFRKLYPGY